MTKTERREHIHQILHEQRRSLDSMQKAIRHLFMANAAAQQLGHAEQVQLTGPPPKRSSK